MRMTTTTMTMMWPGLSWNFDLYSSKYRTRPPMPEGMLTLLSAMGRENVTGYLKMMVGPALPEICGLDGQEKFIYAHGEEKGMASEQVEAYKRAIKQAKLLLGSVESRLETAGSDLDTPSPAAPGRLTRVDIEALLRDLTELGELLPQLQEANAGLKTKVESSFRVMLTLDKKTGWKAKHPVLGRMFGGANP